MQYVFLINRFADRKRVQAMETAIYGLEQRLGKQVVTHFTEYPGHAGVLASDYARSLGKEAIILACGGDGTIHEVANALAHTETPVAIFPMGTGNDFARTVLNASQYENPASILTRIEQHQIRKIDLIKINSFDQKGNLLPMWSHYSVNITSFGLDTMVQSTAKKLVHGVKRNPLVRKNAYQLAVAACLAKGWDFKMHYTLKLATADEQHIDGEMAYCLASICNGKYYGNGFNPAPSAKLDDGLLDFCIVEDMPLVKVIPLVSKYKKGTHIGHPKIHSFRVTSGTLTASEETLQLQGNYDGEDFWGHRVEFHVVPAALPFVFFD